MNDRAPIPTCQAEQAPPRRAALYMRVSTGRQAEHELSIPDQRTQLRTWCRVNGYAVAAEFVEAGASAGDDRRPVFQQMIERACDGGQALTTLLSIATVDSFARPLSRSSTSASLRNMTLE
jgi:DNA invertase Pin-like site-specific DNA recombinase